MSTTAISSPSAFVPRSLADRELIDRETSWIPLEEAPPLTAQQCDAIGRGEIVCPHCGGNQRVQVRAQGATTGVVTSNVKWVRCRCVSHLRFWNGWRKVPERFRDVRRTTLRPRNKRQEEILATMRTHPDDSYYFWGPPGAGKTHFSFVLYRHAIAKAAVEDLDRDDYLQHVWRVTTSVLLNQHVEWERDDDAPTPEVTERMITLAAERGFRPVLFLDEIDKFPPSEFKLARLGEIVDAVYAARGQMVATANKDFAALMQKWEKDAAGTILRRIGSDGGHAVNFGEVV